MGRAYGTHLPAVAQNKKSQMYYIRDSSGDISTRFID
jgi:hypothetical protein